MQLPNRKEIRMKDYDYSLPNVYFLTICTDKRKNLFWENVGAAIRRPEDTVVNQMKGAASRAAGFSVWQKGFYDHVVRSEDDYREIWDYISGNPMQWAEDRISGGKNGHPIK